MRGLMSVVVLSTLLVWALPVSAQTDSEESLSTVRSLPRTRIPPIRWGRDPFQPLVSHPTHVHLKLSAVIYNKEKPSAIIGGEVLYIGERIDGFNVIDIGENYVILRGAGGQVRLEIKR